MGAHFVKLRERLSKRLQIAVSSTMVFPPLDAESLARDLDLKKRGRENGKHGLPPPHAEGFDETEGEIITRINNEWHLASEDNHPTEQ